VRHEDRNVWVPPGKLDQATQLVRDSPHVFMQEVLSDYARARSLECQVPIAPHQISDVENLPSFSGANVVEEMTRSVAMASDGDDARG
jgi:hypothetical protein